jgi:hypothetical protein
VHRAHEKAEEQKLAFFVSLNLELVKVGGYDFPTHVMAPGNDLFKRLLPDTEFDMAAILYKK